jgi:hypothetical protein
VTGRPLRRLMSLPDLSAAHCSSKYSRSFSGSVSGDVLGDYATGSHNGVFADCGIGKDRRTRTHGCSLLDYGPLDFPVGLGLQIPVSRSCPRIAVVDEHHAVADEDVVLNHDALTNKRMTRDLAPLANGCVLRDFNEGADLRFIADFTSVKVDELGELDVSSKLYVWRDAYVRIHGWRNCAF